MQLDWIRFSSLNEKDLTWALAAIRKPFFYERKAWTGRLVGYQQNDEKVKFLLREKGEHRPAWSMK
jgi:hypothetical protein